MRLRVATIFCAPVLVLALLGFASAASAASSKTPRLTGLRCVPTTLKACRDGVRVSVGKQVQVRGRNLRRGCARASWRARPSASGR